MMKTRSQHKLTLNYCFFALLLSLAIVVLFYLGDYLAHSLDIAYAVPSYYFRNKLIYGTLFAFLSLLIFRKQPVPKKAFLLSITVSVLLQTRYFLEGYPKDFVILFLFVHFVILVPASFIVLKMDEKYFKLL